MSKVLSLAFIFIFCLNVFTQTKDEALRDAKITSKATLAYDFKTVIKHTYPPVLKIMGGKEKAITFIKTTFEKMTADGFKFEKADVISVSEIVNEQGQFRCFVKNNNQMVFGNQRIKSESYLLGIYNKNDKFWFFIEAKQLSNPAMSEFFPDFKTELIIPQGKMITEKI